MQKVAAEFCAIAWSTASTVSSSRYSRGKFSARALRNCAELDKVPMQTTAQLNFAPIAPRIPTHPTIGATAAHVPLQSSSRSTVAPSVAGLPTGQSGVVSKRLSFMVQADIPFQDHKLSCPSVHCKYHDHKFCDKTVVRGSYVCESHCERCLNRPMNTQSSMFLTRSVHSSVTCSLT